MKLIVAVLIQKAAGAMLVHVAGGEYLPLASRILKATLGNLKPNLSQFSPNFTPNWYNLNQNCHNLTRKGKCSVFNVDTESLQLAKLIVSLSDLDGALEHGMFDKSGLTTKPEPVTQLNPNLSQLNPSLVTT
jgi:hypothetical protein